MSGLVWITGASSGLGRAAALEFARRGYRVAVTARRADELDKLSVEASGFLGDISVFPGDVTDATAMATVVAEIENGIGPIGVAILNAGSYTPVTARGFTAHAVREQFEINVMGTAHGLEALLPRMIGRQTGKIYLMGSVAGYRGLPLASAYGATKAALNNMAEALHLELRPLGVTLGIINPGFVATPLTAKNSHPMPFLMAADKAASRLVDGVLDGRFEVTFPVIFTFILKIVRCLPDALYFPLVARATRGRKA